MGKDEPPTIKTLTICREGMQIACVVTDATGNEVAWDLTYSDSIQQTEDRYTVQLILHPQPMETSVLVRLNALNSIAVK